MKNSLRLFVLLAAAGTLISCQSPAPTSPPPLAQTLIFDGSAQDGPAFTRSTDVHGATRIYQNNFESAPGPEWSQNQIGRIPKGDRPYLGDFPSRVPVTLALTNLPEHALVRITFDLFVLSGWNGSSPYWGFARWDMNLGDGRNLIHTSFSNNPGDGSRINVTAPQNEQAFPDTFPIRIHPAFTGATEKNTLRDGPPDTIDPSSVYHMVLTFPHVDKDISFGFQSVIQEGKSRYWGLANVSVETLPALVLRSDKDLEQLWKTLADVDATKSYAAQWELAAAGDQAVDYIAGHMAEDANLNEENIMAQIADLENADAEHLNEFLDDISHHGVNAMYPIRLALARTDLSPEYKARLDGLYYITKRHNASISQLRLFRAAQLLDIIHTRRALALKLTIPDPAPRNVDAPNPVPQPRQ